MRKIYSGPSILLLLCSTVPAQTPEPEGSAANSIQPSPSAVVLSAMPQPAFRELKIPAGTRLDIESTYTVSSLDARLGDLLSFRVLVPVKVDEVTVIDQNALVTGRVVKAKRAGHWGKAGKLAWTMQDVIAVDLTRVLLTAQPNLPAGQQGITGQSHGAEVATKTVVMGALLAPLFPIAPLALMSGFKRGENAVLPQGKRFVVYVQADTIVKIPSDVK
jgi:hypothetical protein